MFNTESYAIVPSFYVNRHSVTKNTETVNVKQSVHNVFCCDISGSMYDSLPKMRTQLKNRISSIVGEDDTITIIAFAGTDDCFVLKEKVRVNDLRELKELQNAIDRYLVPMGCTDFVSPIKATNNIVRDEGYYNFVFLSDGGHNESSFSNVIDAINAVAGKINSATIIEYGYWADSERLTRMAELLGGSKIMAEDFDHYTPVIESVFACNAATKVAYPFQYDAELSKPLCVYINPTTNNIHVAMVTNGTVSIPESVTDFYSVSREVLGKEVPSMDATPLYALAYVFADKLEYDLVEDILGRIGDTKFISHYQNAFGKQKLFAFQNELGKAVADTSVRGTIDPNYKPKTDQFSVLDFFDLITKNENNLVCITSPDFEYNRVSAKTVDKTVLTEEAQQALGQAKTVEDAEKILAESGANQVKMTYIDKGYPVTDLTWNEDRANLGAQFKIDVDLEIPKNNLGLTKVRSFVFRNYTIIKDGIVNVSRLPLMLDSETLEELRNIPEIKIEKEIKETTDSKLVYCVVDYSELPVLNKHKVASLSKTEYARLAMEVNTSKFILKYLGSLRTKETELLTESDGYSAEQSALLESYGITGKGYNPQKAVVKDGDYYMALALNSAFKSFSTVPKIDDIAKKKAAGKKLTPSETFMEYVIGMVDDTYLSGKGDRQTMVDTAFKIITKKKRDDSTKLSQMKFALIISHRWFNDANGWDDNTVVMTAPNGQEMTLEIKFSDKKQNL